MFSRTGVFSSTPGDDLLEAIEELFTAYNSWSFHEEIDGRRIWVGHAPYKPQHMSTTWTVTVGLKVVGGNLTIRASESYQDTTQNFPAVVINPCPDPTLTATPNNQGEYDSTTWDNSHVVTVEGEEGESYWITVTNHGLTLFTSNQGEVYYAGVYENFTSDGYQYTGDPYQHRVMIGQIGPTGAVISGSRNWEAKEVSTANAFALETVPLLPGYEGSRFLIRRTGSKTSVGLVPDIRQFLDPEGIVGDSFIAHRKTRPGNYSDGYTIKSYEYCIADTINHLAIQWTFDIDPWAISTYVYMWDAARPLDINRFQLLDRPYWEQLVPKTSDYYPIQQDPNVTYTGDYVAPTTFIKGGLERPCIQIEERAYCPISFSFLNGLEIMMRSHSFKMNGGGAVVRLERLGQKVLEVFQTENAATEKIDSTFVYYNTEGTSFTAPIVSIPQYYDEHLRTFNIALTSGNEMKVWLLGELQSTTAFTLPWQEIDTVLFAPSRTTDPNTSPWSGWGAILESFFIKNGVMSDIARSEIAKAI